MVKAMEDVLVKNITDLEIKISEVVTWFQVESSGKFSRQNHQFD